VSISDSLLLRGDRTAGSPSVANLLPSLVAVLGGYKMSILFQIALAALVILSFVMVVAVPVAYASPQNWDQNKRLLLLGSGLWVLLVLVVGGLNYFVV
jgi:photosystem II PsbZ protein